MKKFYLFITMLLISALSIAQTPTTPTSVAGFPFNGYQFAGGATYRFSIGGSSGIYEWVVSGGEIVSIENNSRTIIVKTAGGVEGSSSTWTITNVRINWLPDNTFKVVTDAQSYIVQWTNSPKYFDLSVRAVLNGSYSNYLHLTGTIVSGKAMAE